MLKKVKIQKNISLICRWIFAILLIDVIYFELGLQCDNWLIDIAFFIFVVYAAVKLFKLDK